MSRHTVKASNVCGTHVENWEGENLGIITDIMIDKRDGRITYLVLSYPGDYGRLWPNKRFAVPFEAIAMRESKVPVEYILNVDQAFLEKSPGFDIDNWPDFANPAFISVIKDYYRDVSLNVFA
jgi:sporulation protein YlmC with PRC-barrel domain